MTEIGVWKRVRIVAILVCHDLQGMPDWNVAVTHAELLEEYQNFHPSILLVLKYDSESNSCQKYITDPLPRKATSIKKWPLLFRAPISTWYRSKLVLVGDAAHPMLPRT